MVTSDGLVTRSWLVTSAMPAGLGFQDSCNCADAELRVAAAGQRDTNMILSLSDVT
jgi:hypothetical protein